MSTAEGIKARIKHVAEQRSAIAAEMSSCIAKLESAGVGMKDALVDNEGYPRADVDIAAIRTDRQRVIGK
jgi:26S proteasome non-ATPase regulatory subunit 9